MPTDADLCAAWGDIVSRMRSRVPPTKTAIVTMRVLTINGEPRAWGKPEVTMVETNRDPASLLAQLGGETELTLP